MSEAGSVYDNEYWRNKGIEKRNKLIAESKNKSISDNNFSNSCNQVVNVQYDCSKIIEKIKGK